MCLAVPGKILEVTEPEGAGRMATVDIQGSRIEASLAVLPDADVGDWVLVHAGFALTVLDEAEAMETFETIRIALGEDIDPTASEG
jgi:hydrogenase expression/formation protein HypC